MTDIDSRRFKESLDRHITGNYGEDQFKGVPEDECCDMCSECCYWKKCTDARKGEVTECELAAVKCPQCSNTISWRYWRNGRVVKCKTCKDFTLHHKGHCVKCGTERG